MLALAEGWSKFRAREAEKLIEVWSSQGSRYFVQIG